LDLQRYPSQPQSPLQVIHGNEGITFAVNHTGMFVDRATLQGWWERRSALRNLAARSNVAMKISGLEMFNHHWTTESFRPYVFESIGAFGVDRCMFSSNFPVDGLHGNYATLWVAYAEIVSGASQPERMGLFCENAACLYRLGSLESPEAP